MKSIFARPLFVNPQAWSVIPALYLMHEAVPYDISEGAYSTKLCANGIVEGKLIEEDDKRIIHLDLYTRDGSCVLGEWYTDATNLDITDNVLTLS